MSYQNRFVIHNATNRPMILNIEPEGVFFPLQEGHEVSIKDEYNTAPVTLRITQEEGEDPIISIWPGDGDVKVEEGGVDVLEWNGSIHDSLGLQP